MDAARKMTKTLSRRLERLEEQMMPTGEPMVLHAAPRRRSCGGSYEGTSNVRPIASRIDTY